MQTQSRRIIKKINILVFLITFLKTILCSENYNFAGKQNPEIDKINNHLLGTTLYFRDHNNNTLFIFNVHSDAGLNFKFKMYSNISIIQQSYENAKTSIIFGIDYNYNSTDISVKNYRADSFFCLFNKERNLCDDYIWDFNENKYKRNNGKNSLGYILLSM